MKPVLQKSFIKSYIKLPKNIKRKFAERVEIYLSNPQNPLLKIHSLNGDMAPMQSMNITADYRALFTVDTKTKKIIFYKIGTHSEHY